VTLLISIPQSLNPFTTPAPRLTRSVRRTSDFVQQAITLKSALTGRQSLSERLSVYSQRMSHKSFSKMKDEFFNKMEDHAAAEAIRSRKPTHGKLRLVGTRHWWGRRGSVSRVDGLVSVIRPTNACNSAHGTTCSISSRNRSRFVFRPYFSNPVCAARVCCRTRLFTSTYTLYAQPVDRRVSSEVP
jgi:hypothetical protein